MSLVPPLAGCPALLKAAGALQTRCAQTVQIPFSAAFPVLGCVPMGFFPSPICPAAPRRRGRKKTRELFERFHSLPLGGGGLGRGGNSQDISRLQLHPPPAPPVKGGEFSPLDDLYGLPLDLELESDRGLLGAKKLTMDAGAGKDHHGRILEGLEAQGPATVRMLWLVGDVEMEAGQAVWPLCGWRGHRVHLTKQTGDGVVAPLLQGRAAEQSGPTALPGRESCPRKEGCRRVRRRGRAWQANRQSGRR